MSLMTGNAVVGVSKTASAKRGPKQQNDAPWNSKSSVRLLTLIFRSFSHS
jgi:hypothetical protein